MPEKFKFPKRGFFTVADKVGEADYFLDQLKDKAGYNREFEYVLSAFTSASRSITFSLQAVMSHFPGFREWYIPHQERLGQFEVARYFKDLRNHGQKVGDQPVYHSGWVRNGVFHHSARFSSSEDLGEPPKGEIIELAETYFKQLLSMLQECYKSFSAYVDPRAVFTLEGLATLGWSIEDLEESLGFPRGWTDITWNEESKSQERLNLLSRSGGDEMMEHYFKKYGLVEN